MARVKEHLPSTGCCYTILKPAQSWQIIVRSPPAKAFPKSLP